MGLCWIRTNQQQVSKQTDFKWKLEQAWYRRHIEY